MRTPVLLLTGIACCCALAAAPSASAWEPLNVEADTMSLTTNGGMTLEVPMYANGTIYLGDMLIQCPVVDLSFNYWEGAENLLTNGLFSIDDAYCYPEYESGASSLDYCTFGASGGGASNLANGDVTTQNIVIHNGPNFNFQFQGLSCPFLNGTFSVGIPGSDSCQPPYDDGNGDILFNDNACLEVQTPISVSILRDGDTAEIEGLFEMYDPVSPPYME